MLFCYFDFKRRSQISLWLYFYLLLSFAIQTFHRLYYVDVVLGQNSTRNMAPSLADEILEVPLPTIAETNVSNGKHSITEDNHDDPVPVKKGKYNAIPGPLGLASASLEGKVALVTGAGK